MPDWIVPGYTESRELGSGASGRVVLARHDATGTPVAVKYLSDRLRANPGFRQGFRAEAELLGALTSSYVTGLYEYVEAPQGAAIVMELVDGAALRQLLRSHGPTGPEAALTVLKGSLLGLAAAHRAGVVHRDYKPENVLVGREGLSKLVDFGIAARDGDSPGAAGTPAYMAPEQWNGEPASPAADVYAATACFYECLTGRKPYHGENIAELAYQHLTAPVPDQDEDVPEAVRELIRRGLAKSPPDRPADATAFVAELEAVATAEYGPQWEERGQRKLAALAALLPLLLPSPRDVADGVTELATTTVGGGRRWQDWLLGVGTLLLAVALLTTASAVGGQSQNAVAEVAATTSATPKDDAAGPPAGEPGEPPEAQSPSPGATTSPSATDPPTGTPPDTDADTDTHTDTDPDTDGDTDTDPDTPTDTGDGGTAPGEPGSGDPSAPPPNTEDEAPVKVVDVTVNGLKPTGGVGATTTISVTTNGNAPVSLHISWHLDDGKTNRQDGATQTFALSGKTQYTVTAEHTFSDRGPCYWEVRASTTPQSADGGASQRITAPRCQVD